MYPITSHRIPSVIHSSPYFKPTCDKLEQVWLFVRVDCEINGCICTDTQCSRKFFGYDIYQLEFKHESRSRCAILFESTLLNLSASLGANGKVASFTVALNEYKLETETDFYDYFATKWFSNTTCGEFVLESTPSSPEDVSFLFINGEYEFKGQCTIGSNAFSCNFS